MMQMFDEKTSKRIAALIKDMKKDDLCRLSELTAKIAKDDLMVTPGSTYSKKGLIEVVRYLPLPKYDESVCEAAA